MHTLLASLLSDAVVVTHHTYYGPVAFCLLGIVIAVAAHWFSGEMGSPGYKMAVGLGILLFVVGLFWLIAGLL